MLKLQHNCTHLTLAMAPHSSTLAWKIPWTEEPGRLQSMGSLRVGHNWATSLSLFTFMRGEGNGNPLQCSCLENPRDGGAWWAAVYGVTQSRTRLKQLSSSSSSSVVTKSCLTFLRPWAGSSVYGISQARILRYVAISFPKGYSQPRDWTQVSCIGRWILYHWATREAHDTCILYCWFCPISREINTRRKPRNLAFRV